MPEAVVALGERKRIVGRLRFESDGRRQHSQFEYDEAWLAAEDRFALAPGLPLRGGSHFSSAKDDRRSALPGCFGDAAPDSWGRALMTRALGGGLSEFDYLVLLAFDINPSPWRHRVLETGIIQGGSFAASLELAIEACEFFDVRPKNTKSQTLAVARTVAANWKQSLRDAGASADDIQNYADAFEHAAMDEALSLALHE